MRAVCAYLAGVIGMGVAVAAMTFLFMQLVWLFSKYPQYVPVVGALILVLICSKVFAEAGSLVLSTLGWKEKE